MRGKRSVHVERAGRLSNARAWPRRSTPTRSDEAPPDRVKVGEIRSSTVTSHLSSHAFHINGDQGERRR